MGLVINEEKTKFQCRAVESTELSINNKNIERVRHYKYLRMYVGYTADNKEAELNNLLTQCKARLQPIKVLAWSRTGVGVCFEVHVHQHSEVPHRLRPFCTFFLWLRKNGKTREVTKRSNEDHIKLPQKRYGGVYGIRAQPPALRDRVSQVNTAAAIRHMRAKGGNTLITTIVTKLENPSSGRQGRNKYLASLVSDSHKFSLKSSCVT